MRKPAKKLKPAKKVSVIVEKAKPVQTAKRLADKLRAQKDPGCTSTFADVSNALKAILTFDDNRAANKKIAYGVLGHFGVRALTDLPLHQYDAAVVRARITRSGMVFHKQIDDRAKRIVAEQISEQTVSRGKMAVDLHFLLRAVSSLLNCDSALATIATQIKLVDPTLEKIEQIDALLHERGALVIGPLLAQATKVLDALIADGLPFAAGKIMHRRLVAATAALVDYDFKKRYAAAAEIKIAIEVWGAVTSVAL